MNLQKACLAVVPMTEQEIEAIYTYPGQLSVKEVTRLCLSHERLRAELAGAEIILKNHGILQ